MDFLINHAERAFGIHLSKRQQRQFYSYYDELVKWNNLFNLTSITDLREVQTRHFLDSLRISKVFDDKNLCDKAKVLDLGSGAGLPGIPLKIAFPKLELTLLDATAKKTDFLSHVVDILDLDGIKVCNRRSEHLAHVDGYRENYDVVLSRAVANLSVLAELALPFCKLGGFVVVIKGPEVEKEVLESKVAIELMGGQLFGVQSSESSWDNRVANLITLDKNRLTPAKYPRRPGMPTKRPIGVRQDQPI